MIEGNIYVSLWLAAREERCFCVSYTSYLKCLKCTIGNVSNFLALLLLLPTAHIFQLKVFFL